MDLEKNLKLIWQTLLTCKMNYDVVYYLNTTSSQEELDIIRKSSFFRNTSNSLWKLVGIDIHKLFSESNQDKTSLKKLINKLKNKEYTGHNIESHKIDDWEKEIMANRIAIQKIRVLRNKLYAHTDPNSEINFDLYFKEVLDLILLCEKILVEIYSTSMDIHLMCFPHSLKHTGELEVQRLVSEKKTRDLKRKNLFDQIK